MLIVLMGDSCVGKTTLANALNEQLQGKIFTGKDYLRFAKNEANAKKEFTKFLADSVTGENVLYCITDKEYLQLVPEGAKKILVTASLETIQNRFQQRLNMPVLPEPLKNMLARKYNQFINEDVDLCIDESDSQEEITRKINTILDK